MRASEKKSIGDKKCCFMLPKGQMGIVVLKTNMISRITQYERKRIPCHADSASTFILRKL